MGNLLEEPRILKDIVIPKVKKRAPKKVKTDGPKDVKFTVFGETSKTNVNELIRIYKTDPFKARVKYFSEKDSGSGFMFYRTVLFEYPDGNFQIVVFRVKFGISVTNKIYSCQSKETFISYKKGKFWYKGLRGEIRPLTYNLFCNFLCSTIDGKIEIRKYLSEKFHWFKTISEINTGGTIPFNTIVSKKLFGLNDILRYEFKVPINVAKKIIRSDFSDNLIGSRSTIKTWGEMLKVLENVNELREEMLNDHHFIDTCKMAHVLGRKVNCKWGLKRLQQEHDNWSKEITLIKLESVIEYELNIKEIYKLFAEFSGYRLLRTNKDMLIEGSTNKHCVGTYIDSVDSGRCAIYHINGYTLQLTELYYDQNVNGEKIRGLTLRNAQFRGYKNENAPIELFDEVEEKIDRFKESKLFLDYINAETKDDKSDKDEKLGDLFHVVNELPF